QDRFPAGHVETLDTECNRVGQNPAEGLAGKARSLPGARVDQAVAAGEVAGVVRVQPELPEPLGTDVARTALVGRALEGLERQESRAQTRLQKVVHVKPRLPGVDSLLKGVSRDERAEGRPSVQPI